MSLQSTDDLIELLLNISADDYLSITLMDGLTVICRIEHLGTTYHHSAGEWEIVVSLYIGWNDEILPFYRSIDRDGILTTHSLYDGEWFCGRPSLQLYYAGGKGTPPFEIERIDPISPPEGYHFGMYHSVTNRQLHHELATFLFTVEPEDSLRIEFEDGTSLIARVSGNESWGSVAYIPTCAHVLVNIEVDSDSSTADCPTSKAAITSVRHHQSADGDLSSETVRPFVHWRDDATNSECTGEFIETGPQQIERIDTHDDN